MECIGNEYVLPNEKYDYLIIAPNIEERSGFFCRKFMTKNIFKKVILMDYPNFHSGLSEEQEEHFLCDFCGKEFIHLKCDNDDDAIYKLCEAGIKQQDNIAFDMTGFSIPNIYRIMHAFKYGIKINILDVYYTEPLSYVYDKGYYDAYHAYLGERKCVPVKGYYYSGRNEKEILTIFLGFESGLAYNVYFKLSEDAADTVETLVVNGFPSYTPKLKDVSLYNNEQIITQIGRERVYHATASNPFSAYNLLCTILEKNRGKLLNICTIGAKPMALGACIFALENAGKVKRVYPFYEKKNFDVNEKPGKTWKYTVEI